MSGTLRYALAEPREAVYVLPRAFACRVFGVHSHSCLGRHDDKHLAWRRDMRAVRWQGWREPWWDRVQPISELQFGWIRVRDETPLPERVDIAVSQIRRRRRWRDEDPERDQVALQGTGCCAVCEARWRAGRGIKHAACSDRIWRAVERYLDTKRELERTANGGGA